MTKIQTLLLLKVLAFSFFPAAKGEDKADVQFFGDFYLPEGRKLRSYQDHELIKSIAGNSQLNIVNLEGVIGPAFFPRTFKRFLLRMDEEATTALQQLNVQAVTLANNHSMDFGYFGLLSTMSRLSRAGILFQGAGSTISSAIKPLVLSLRQTNLCILSFSRTYPSEHWATSGRPGSAYLSFRRTALHVRQSKKACNGLLATLFHWGEEGYEHAKKYQIKLARLAIDAGADLVVGHHPHVIQEVEIYKHKPIAYSLGNFIFGRSEGHAPFQDGASLRLYLSEKGNIERFAIVLLPTAEDAELDKLKASLPQHCVADAKTRTMQCALDAES